MANRLLDLIRRPPPVTKGDTELGRSGTVNTRGFLSDDEFNLKLRWPNNLQVYDQMRRTDSTVRWMLALVKTPIRAATWVVQPADEDPKSLEIAAFCEHALFQELEGGFDNFLRQALTFLDFGHSVFEQVAEYRSVQFDWTDRSGGDQPTTVSRDGFVFKRLSPRLAQTIYRWIPSGNDSSKLAAIEQILDDGSGTATIPADRLVVFVNEQEGDDWRGQSLLRTAYKSYRYKQELENLEAIAYERSVGLPIVYPPDNANPDELAVMEDAISKIRQGEALYVILPGPKAGTTDDKNGWLIEDLAIDGSAMGDPNDSINRHDAALARNVMAEFMRLGQTAVGARATADVQQDPYYSGVEAVAGYIEEMVTRKIIAPLVAWNYADVEHLPQFKASKIHAQSMVRIATLITQLAGQELIQPDDRLEAWLRELVDGPPIDHANRQERLQQEQQAKAQELAARAAASPNAGNGNPNPKAQQKGGKGGNAGQSSSSE